MRILLSGAIFFMSLAALMSQDSDRLWSLGKPELRADGVSVVIALKAENELDRQAVKNHPMGIGLQRDGQNIFFGDLYNLQKVDLNEVLNVWPKWTSGTGGIDYVFNAGNADEIAALKALTDDCIIWESKPHSPGPTGYRPPPGIKVFHGATGDFKVNYAEESKGGIFIELKASPGSRMLLLNINQPSALAFAIKNIPQLLHLRDEAFAQKEQRRLADLAAKDQQMEDAVKAEKEASAQRLKEFQMQEELKVKQTEQKKQLDEIAAQEVAQKAAIEKKVQAEIAVKILDYLATTNGKKLKKRIDSSWDEIKKQSKEEYKGVTDLEKQYVDYLQATAIFPSFREKQQVEEYLRQFLRAQANYKESTELKQKRQELSKYLDQFNEACGYKYDEAMKIIKSQ